MRAFCSALILAICLSVTAFSHARRPSIYSALHRCPLRALATNDNDIRLDMDPRPKGWKVALPATVAEVIYHAASKDVASQDGQTIRWATTHCDVTLDSIYRLNVPNGLQLYVARVYLPLEVEFFHLVIFDPKSRKVTSNPQRLSAKWTEDFGFDNDLAKPPVFRFVRDLSGQTQLVFSEYAHNGTVYNAVIDRYLEIGADLSFKQVMAIEKVVVDIAPNSDGVIVRRPRQIAPGRIEVSVYERPEKGPERRLGSFLLTRKGVGQPYEVVDRHVVGSIRSDALVDLCEGFSDNEFQRVGCDFYY